MKRLRERGVRGTRTEDEGYCKGMREKKSDKTASASNWPAIIEHKLVLKPASGIYALVVLLGQARIQAASSHKSRNAMTSLIMINHNH